MTKACRATSALLFPLVVALTSLHAPASMAWGADLPEISVLTWYDSIEEGADARFTLMSSLRPADSFPVSVSIRQTGTFAPSGQTGRRTVIIDSRGRGDFTVATTDDQTNEATGTIQVTINPGRGYQVSTQSEYRSATVEVTDNDQPVITITPGSKISEGGTARFNLSANPRPAAPIDVNVTVAETGSFASPGQLGGRTVTIATNGRGTLKVRTDSDSTDEYDGSITATLRSGPDYAVGTPASASLDVTDGGTPTPRISIRATPTGIVEGDTVTFALTASPRPASPVDVRVEVTDSGSFVRPGQTGSRTLTIGRTGRVTFAVETENDLTTEPDGTLTAEVLSGSGYLVVSPGRAAVGVRDETVRISIHSDGDIAEGGIATFSLTANPVPPEILDVEVSITESGDFLPSGAYTETVAIGTDGRGTLSVDTSHDDKAESDGALTASVVSGIRYAAGSPAQATARVADSTPLVTITAGPSIIEGDTATFTLAASPAPRYNTSVTVHVDEEVPGRFTRSDETGTRLAALYTDGTGILEIRTEDDETDEGGVDITATIIADGGDYYRIGSPASASLRINDNDSAPGDLTVSVADAEVREGERNGPYGRTELRFPVTLNKAADKTVMAHFAIRAHESADTSPATAGEDYRDAVPLWVRFDPGETEEVLAVVIYEDAEYEELPETFELVISRVYGAEIADGLAIGTILPDPADAPRDTPVVTITSGEAVWEGQAATFTLTADPAPAEDLVVDITVFDDSIGSLPSDYLADSDEGAHTITIPAVDKGAFEFFGNSVATLTLQTVDDSVEEASGKVRVTVETATDGRYYANQAPYEAEVDVRDNDGPPLVMPPAFSVSDATANEADGYIVFDVTLDPPVPADRGPMTVFYQIRSWGHSPGGAKRNVDFEDRHGTLTFYEGETLQQVEIPIIDDDQDEGRESFHLYLSRPSGGATIADSVGRGTIIDVADDTEGPPAAPDYTALITQMYEWRNDPEYVAHKSHTDRWDRALLAFGQPVTDSTLTPMTAAEAQAFADRGWTRWVEVAAALWEIEAADSAQEEDAPPVEPDPHAGLIAQMYEWRNDPEYVAHKSHTDRWDRALLAFGEPVTDSTLTPMTVAEAQGFADRGWSRWVEVAAALHALEASDP